MAGNCRIQASNQLNDALIIFKLIVSWTKTSQRTPTMPDSDIERIEFLLESFYECCETDLLTLEFVKEQIASLSEVSGTIEFDDIIKQFSLLHKICANDNDELVSLEIVEEVLKFHPDAASISEDCYGSFDVVGYSYPLHAACWNDHCPLSVIELLIAKYPFALTHLGIHNGGIRCSTVDWEAEYLHMEAAPLSYYLQRSTNLKLEGVKLLIEACPKSLQIAEGSRGFTPLHALALNKNLSEYVDVMKYLLSHPTVSGKSDIYQSLLHTICSNDKVPLDVVHEILKLHPNAMHEPVDTYGFVQSNNHEGGKIGSSYPLHVACKNENCPLSVIQLLVTNNSAALGELCLVGYGIKHCFDDFHGLTTEGTPLQYFLERQSNLTLEGVKLLVRTFPGALKITDEKKRFTPLHTLAQNPKISDHLDIVQYLVGVEPSLLRIQTGYVSFEFDWRGNGSIPLHILCWENAKASWKVVKFLVESWPGSIHQNTWHDCNPLHCLCQNSRLDDEAALAILKILVEQDRTKAQEFDFQRNLPIHFAAGQGRRDRAFCEYLVDQFPESIRAGNVYNQLPMHRACSNGRLETVKYIAALYPESVGSKIFNGYLPVHETVFNEEDREGIFDFLQTIDPGSLSRKVNAEESGRFEGNLPIHALLEFKCHRPDLGVKHLFDSYPESIFARNDMGRTPGDVMRARNVYGEYVIKKIAKFFAVQSKYCSEATRIDEVTQRDDKGRFLLHRAVLDKDASLGSIKTILNSFPGAIRAQDNDGMLPVQLACYRGFPYILGYNLNHDKFDVLPVLRYLLEQDQGTANALDATGNNLLHLVCKHGDPKAVMYLYEHYPFLVSTENDAGLLPIHVLCDKRDKEWFMKNSVEYTSAIWHLLVAHPLTVASALTSGFGSISIEEPSVHKRKRDEEANQE